MLQHQNYSFRPPCICLSGQHRRRRTTGLRFCPLLKLTQYCDGDVCGVGGSHSVVRAAVVVPRVVPRYVLCAPTS